MNLDFFILQRFLPLIISEGHTKSGKKGCVEVIKVTCLLQLAAVGLVASTVFHLTLYVAERTKSTFKFVILYVTAETAFIRSYSNFIIAASLSL